MAKIFFGCLLIATIFLGSCKEGPHESNNLTPDSNKAQATKKEQSRIGKFIINPRFNSAREFSENLAAVSAIESGVEKWGYIDKSGQFVINPHFSFAGSFSEGLAPVRYGDDKNGKWGYVDKNGVLVINPQYDGAESFSEGLAFVRRGRGGAEKWGVIDRTGKTVILPQFIIEQTWLNLDEVVYSREGFSDGLARVSIGSGESVKWGFIDKIGNFSINPKFDNVWPFSDGLARVSIRKSKTLYFKIIDKDGKYINDERYEAVGQFRNGLAWIRFGPYQTGKYGFIDKAGRLVINPGYDYVGDFAEGYAAVRIGDEVSGRWGFIDKKGNFLFEAKLKYFDFSRLELIRARRFQQGLALVAEKRNNEIFFGFVDTTGKLVIDYQFSDAHGFSEGLAPVKVGGSSSGKWGFISRD